MLVEQVYRIGCSFFRSYCVTELSDSRILGRNFSGIANEILEVLTRNNADTIYADSPIGIYRRFMKNLLQRMKINVKRVVQFIIRAKLCLQLNFNIREMTVMIGS